MKVLHVITGLNMGGAERALVNVLAGGLADEFNSEVVSLGDEGKYGEPIRALDVPVHTLKMRRGLPSRRALLALRRIVVDFRPDVIQGWMYHGNFAATLGAWLAPGKPALAWNIRHGLYGLKAEKALTRQVIRGNRIFSTHADAVLYNADLSRKQHEAFGIKSVNGRVIPNGFDLTRWAPNALARESVRAEFDIPDDALLVGHFARYHPMKDHANYLQALHTVISNHPKAHFLLAGRGVNADNFALSSLFEGLPADRVHVLGERSDIERLMPALDVFCLSSSSEAFPNVLGEAMACGVPCVTTDVGDSASIVTKTGLVVSPRDSAALADALSWMLGMARQQRRALGEASRVRVEANYSLGAVVGEYAGLYRDLGERNEI